LARPFSSPFEKLSVDNQKVLIEQLSPGGELFSLFEEILNQLQSTDDRQQKDEAKTKVSLFSGLTIKEALAWKLLGEKGLQSIGKGLGAIAEVIDKMTTAGKEVKERIEGIAMGIETVFGIAPKILKFAFTMVLALPLLMLAVVAVPFIGLLLLGTLAIMGILSKVAEKQKGMYESLALLGDVGAAILKFGGYLALSALVYPIALLGMIVVIPTLLIMLAALTLIGRLVDPKSMEKYKGLEEVGKAILLFGGYLALSLLIYPFAILATPMVLGVIVGFAVVFALLDRFGFVKSVNKAGKALKQVGIAILVLGAALFIFGLIFPPTVETFQTLGFVMLVLVGISAAMWLVGKMYKKMRKGAIGLALTGLAILVLGYALKKFEESLPANPWEFFAELGVALVGLGVIMYGYGSQWKSIAKGALVLAGSGLALALMGYGISEIGEALNSTGDAWMFMAELGVFLVGMGVMAAGWGAAVMLIGPGLLAMGGAGVALKSVSWGLEGFIPIFKGSEWKSMVGEHHKSKGILGMGGGSVSNFQALMEAVGYSFIWNPVSVAGILGGAAALGAAGLALKPLAKGINDMIPIFKGKGWKEMVETKGNPKAGGILGFGATEQTNIQLLISSIANSFKLGFGVINVGAGAGAMAIVGKSLSKLAVGLNDFMKYKISKTIAKNIASMVDAVAGTFGEIGKEYGGAGFFGLGAGPLYDGIEATMGMGDALTSIAKGMAAVAELRFPTYGDPKNPGKITEYITLDKGKMRDVSANVADMVDALASAFGEVGKRYPNKPASGLWGFFGGTENPVKTGLSSVSGMGSALGGIAQGMQDFSTLKFHKYDDPTNPEKITATIDLTQGDVLSEVTANIVSMIDSLATGFAQIGIRYPKVKKKGWFGITYSTNGPVGVGIEQSSGMGAIVAAIGQGMRDFSEMKFPVYDGTKVVEYIDLTKGNALKKVTSNITEMVLSLAGGFAEVARRFPRKKYKTWWGATRYAPDGTVGEGVKQASGMGGVISELGSGLKDFSTLKFPIYKGTKVVGYTTLTSQTMGKTTDNIVYMIESLMNGFAKIGDKYGSWPGTRSSVQQGVQAAQGAGFEVAMLAIGLKSMAMLRFPIYKGKRIVGYESLTGDGIEKVARNIYMMISSPLDAFGRIGKKYGGEVVSFMGVRSGDGGDVGKGILAAKELPKGLGTVMGSILGVVSHKNFKEVVKATPIVSKMVTMIGESFEPLAKAGPDGIMASANAVKYYFEQFATIETPIKNWLKLSDNYRTMQLTNRYFAGIARSTKEIGETPVFGAMMLSRLTKTLQDRKLMKTALAMTHIANAYKKIQVSSTEMEIEALEKSTEMFKALSYLTEQGGETAIEALGDNLIEAVKELASMIANFEQTVGDAKDQNADVAEKMENTGSIFDRVAAVFSDNPATPIGQPTPSADPSPSSSSGDMQELIDILTSGDAIVQVQKTFD